MRARIASSEAKKLAWATLAVAFALMLWPHDANGATGSGNSKVKTVLTHADSLGSCMAYVGGIPTNLNCRHNGEGVGWVTFDCAGRWKPASRGRDSLKLATLAMITNRPIKYRVDDTERVSRYCHAYQVSFTYK